MIIIPSIDIQDGQCVRLMQGDFDRVSLYQAKPEDVASSFSAAAAEVLHVVDLDGAKSGRIAQVECIASIRQFFSNTLQVGGGIRSTEDIDALLAVKVDRVVVGSSAVSNVEMTRAWFEHYGPEVIVLALDFYMEEGVPYLSIKGWQEKTQQSLWDVVEQYPSLKHVLCTDIRKDGMRTGPNFEFYQAFKEKYPHIHIQASGGVSSIADVKALNALNIDAAIIGRALHENQLDLKEAIACSK